MLPASSWPGEQRRHPPNREKLGGIIGVGTGETGLPVGANAWPSPSVDELWGDTGKGRQHPFDAAATSANASITVLPQGGADVRQDSPRSCGYKSRLRRGERRSRRRLVIGLSGFVECDPGPYGISQGPLVLLRGKFEGFVPARWPRLRETGPLRRRRRPAYPACPAACRQ